MESAGMMKMATGEGSPLRQGAETGSRLVFGGYRGLRWWNSRSMFLSGGLGIYRRIWHREQVRRTHGVSTRHRGMPQRGGRALHPRGPLVAPLTYFFLLYIPIYPKTIGEQNRSGVPPPQASVATKNQSGPCSGTLPKGGTLTGGHLHHPGALHDEEGVVHPRG